jgi:nucleoside-diphosphate-sugar epimerase
MAETMLVTGGCGFIGSCFVLQQMQQYPDIHLINLDKLTYAGNPENIKEVVDNPRYTLVQADVADRPAVNVLGRIQRPLRTPVAHEHLRLEREDMMSEWDQALYEFLVDHKRALLHGEETS